MVIVVAEPDQVETDLAAGVLACPPLRRCVAPVGVRGQPTGPPA